MAEEQTKPLRFFKVLLPGFSTKLRLPCDFVARNINSSKRETAALLSPNGKVWNVDCFRGQKEAVFLGERWSAFTKKNNLGVGFFLVFHYKGNMAFSFRAFDLSSREISYSPSIPQKGLNMKVEIISDSDADRNIKPSYKKRKVEVAQKPQFEVIIEAHNLKGLRWNLLIPLEFTRTCDLLKGHNRVTIRDPKSRMWPVGLSHGLKNTVYISKGWLEFARGNELKEGNRCIFELVSQTDGNGLMMNVKILDNKTPNINPIKSENQGSSEICFEATLKSYNLGHNFLYIPVGFMKSSGLIGCSKLTLRDPTNQLWHARLCYKGCSYGRRLEAYISMGWLEFANANKLQEGDRCMFKLISEENQNVVQVQILKHQQPKLTE